MLVEQTSPRISFAAQVLFVHILGFQVEIRTQLTEREHAALGYPPVLAYGKVDFPADDERTLFVPAHPWMKLPVAELITRQPEKEVDWGEHEGIRFPFFIPPIAPDNAKPPPKQLPFDPFLLCFWVAAGVDYYRDDLERDTHQRLPMAEHLVFRMGEWEAPVCHKIAALVGEHFGVGCPRGIRKLRYTIDIDQAFRYRDKTLVRRAAKFIKDLFRLNGQEIIQAMGAAMGLGKDPYYPGWERVVKHFPPSNTYLFWLTARDTIYDQRYRPAAFKRWLRKIRDRGYECGAHPGYNAGADQAILHRDVARLRSIGGFAVRSVRMHYGRMPTPAWTASLQKVGVEDDFSCIAIEQPGFPLGVAIPIPQYDVLNDRKTGIWLHTSSLMDRTLEKYLGLSPGQALRVALDHISTLETWGGELNLLFHNTTFADFCEWHGWWDEFVLPLITQLAKIDELHAPISGVENANR